jgi:hypothetical protein
MSVTTHYKYNNRIITIVSTEATKDENGELVIRTLTEVRPVPANLPVVSIPSVWTEPISKLPTSVTTTTSSDPSFITLNVDNSAATPTAPSDSPSLPESDGATESVALPLGASCPVPEPYKLGTTPTRKERGVMGLVRGLYTVLFTILGMIGAGAAYLRDNLDKLFQLDWKVYAVVGIGAVLSGILYALKKYWKPDGLL